MTKKAFDLLVIGAGSGGVRAARMAAMAGARVAVIEAGDLGGTCVNLGCVPKKLMMYAGQFAESAELAAYSGWDIRKGEHDWAHFIARKNVEITRLNQIYARLLEGAGVKIIRGYATFVDAHTVSVETMHYSAEHILIAVGSTPRAPDVPGGQYAINSDDIFHLPARPERLLIVGGGFIATEFACIMHGLGSTVTQLYRGSCLLRGFDLPGRELLVEQMRERGINVLHHAEVEQITQQAEGLCVTFRHDEQRQTILADQVLYATGRVPNLDGLGLEKLNLLQDKNGHLVVNEKFQTRLRSVYALGDVIGRVGLTPVAINEAMILVDHLFGSGQKSPLDYAYIPQAVFSSPALAKVGPTEEELQAAMIDYVAYSVRFKPMMYSFAPEDQHEIDYYRLLVDASSDRVLAAHLLGRDAPEIMQMLAVAIKAGATKADFDAVVGIHPTSAEELVTIRTPE